MSVFAKQTSRFFKLKNVGDQIAGTITEISEPRQATKYDPRPGAPRVLDFWESKDGGPARPKMEVILTIQTDLNEGPDETGTPDDGQRKLVVPVFYKDGSMLSEIQKAMVQAGGKDIETGAWVGVRHTGHDPESANPDNPRKLYQAAYKRPAGGGGVFAEGANDQQQAPAQPAQQQWQQPAAQPAANPGWNAPEPQQAQPAWQPPVQVNTGTGEVNGGVPATDPWGAPVQAPLQPQQAWEPPRNEQAMGQPVVPQTAQQEQAVRAFNGGAAQQQWQPPAAQQPAAPQVDQAKVLDLIRQGAPDGYITENTGATTAQISALRNM